MSQNNSSKLLAAFAVAALVAAAAPARAEQGETQSRMVQIGDLNLQTPSGQATLRLRVKTAARAVCGPAESLGSADYDSYAGCVQQAEAHAGTVADAMISRATDSRFASLTPAR